MMPSMSDVPHCSRLSATSRSAVLREHLQLPSPRPAFGIGRHLRLQVEPDATLAVHD